MKVNEYGIETADFENEKGKALDWCRDYFGERSEPRNSEIYKKERIRMQEVFRELKFNRLADIDEVVAEDSGESSGEFGKLDGKLYSLIVFSGYRLAIAMNGVQIIHTI